MIQVLNQLVLCFKFEKIVPEMLFFVKGYGRRVNISGQESTQ